MLLNLCYCIEELVVGQLVLGDTLSLLDIVAAVQDAAWLATALSLAVVQAAVLQALLLIVGALFEGVKKFLGARFFPLLGFGLGGALASLFSGVIHETLVPALTPRTVLVVAFLFGPVF